VAPEDQKKGTQEPIVESLTNLEYPPGSSSTCAKTDDEPLLAARDLSVTYGSHRALGSITLGVPERRLLAIVGPSGCGKSTFLASLNRMTDLIAGCRVEGSIRLGGEDILSSDCDLLTLRRRVGMVFQKPNPFPMSIRKNLALPLREHGIPKADIDTVIESTLRDVGLWDEVKDRLQRSARTLSGGQQQRLCIARALALRPEVMLFDEPCSALDPLSINVVEQLIASLRDRVTVVIVTHNLAQARRIADYAAVFWLREGVGTVIESGPAARVFKTPQDPDAIAYLTGSCC